MPVKSHQAQPLVETLGATLREKPRSLVASPEQSRRQVESHALDVAQRSIWPAVLDGDPDAIKLFLQIHDRRVKLWGLAETQRDQHWSIEIRRDTGG